MTGHLDSRKAFQKSDEQLRFDIEDPSTTEGPEK